MDSSVAPVMADNGHEIPPRKPSKGCWNSAIFIIFVEMAERFAYYGLAGNLITYLTNDLGESTAVAAKNVNNWIGVSSIFPIIGAFIADSYLGRFRTILVASVIYLAGMILLTITVSVIPWRFRKSVFFTALYILAIGEGGHKPCVQTFAADQFDDEMPDEKIAKSSFFNWWYSGIVVGATLAILVVIYIQDNVGWAAGFGVLAGALATALVLFLIGIKRYRTQGPLGSPYTTVARVFVAALRKRHVNEEPHGRGICYGGDVEGQPWVRNLARTNQFKFLDKAIIIENVDASNKIRNQWRLCTQNEVEEVKLVLRLIPIWLSCLMFTTIQAQLNTFFIKQGSTMVRTIGPHFQLPPASLQGVVGLTILALIPIYDRVFVPITRSFTGHPSGITMLQRIGIGLCLSILNMVVSALVESKRVSVAIHYGLENAPKTTLPMSVWWLLPQYMICGTSDVFTIVGMQELFYDQMPQAMRSMGAAAYISIIGVGSFISSGLISVVQGISSGSGEKWLGDNLNKAHLNYFYWVLAGLGGLNLCVYIWVAKGFVYKKIEGQENNQEKEMGMAR